MTHAHIQNQHEKMTNNHNKTSVTTVSRLLETLPTQ